MGSVRMTAEWRAVWSEWAWLTKTHSLDLTGIFGSIQIPNRGKWRPPSRYWNSKAEARSESVTPTPLRDPSRTLHVQAQKFAFPVSHVQAAIEQYRCGPDFTAGYLGASDLLIA